ncbi:MAG TPA: succinyldiaminopimelate transaminase [Streptosporangiaceae bacterium]|nr:succinyldiaminopimelate transaminase [Streptosporangiaceae bacterium]
MTLASRLPRVGWDLLAPYKEKAAAHPAGLVDLSVGTPVDPVPPVVRTALAAAADSPGYPATQGTQRLREAAAGWLARRHGVSVSPEAVLPVIGTKEFISWLPLMLGCGPGDTVVHPELAYPTYAIGALLAGARVAAADGLLSLGPERVRLIWVNSPANPTGRVLPAGHLAKMARWARERGAVLASDECYLDLGYPAQPVSAQPVSAQAVSAQPVSAQPVSAQPVSALHPSACDASHQGLLGVYSLSKRSNLAGYRAGFVAGDPDLIAQLREVRRHAGMLVPGPVQAAMAAALDDDEHAEEQRARYAARRDLLAAALTTAGWRIEHSEAGLYLWATHPDRDGWASAEALAQAGILVAPGELYGPAGARHIRVSLTATDERVRSAVARLPTLADLRND